MNVKRNLIHWTNLLYMLIVGASLYIAGGPGEGLAASAGQAQQAPPAVARGRPSLDQPLPFKSG